MNRLIEAIKKLAEAYSININPIKQNDYEK